MPKLNVRLIALTLGFALAAAAPLSAQTEQQKLVDECLVTWNNFQTDPNLTWFREHDHEAVGFLIAAQVVKAGFVFGGSGGRAVLVAKGEKGWAGPAFYTMGTASAGFQAGVDVSEVITLVMTKKALDKLMTGQVKAGRRRQRLRGAGRRRRRDDAPCRPSRLHALKGALRRRQRPGHVDQADRGLEQGLLRKARLPHRHRHPRRVRQSGRSAAAQSHRNDGDEVGARLSSK